MFAWKRSLQKIHSLIFCNTKNPQTYYKACFSMTNGSQKRQYSNTESLVTPDDVEKFFGIFPRVVEELITQKQSEQLFISNEHFASLLDHVLPHGKKFRGLMLIGSCKILDKEMPEEKVTIVNIAAWILEMFHSYYIVTDDIVDNSEVRRGLPCWHTKEEVGLTAVFDAIYLYQESFLLLKKYFGNHQNYTKMFHVLHEASLKTAQGQILDTMFTVNGKPNLSLFTMNRFKIYSDLKTSYYSVYAPVLLALLITEFPFTKEHYQQILNLTFKLGQFYQIQNDYVDCYKEKFGKTGNDIAEGKCTWLVVTALEKANSKQRKLIEKYYGVADDEATANIKNVYDELNLSKLYHTFEAEFLNGIYADIRNLPKELPHALFVKVTNYCKERGTSQAY